MQDGEIRRKAEALVNEEFGVYSRKAVVREDLAAYDARLEEAYKCMKEGEKLADKDYDKDGKIESPKDEVWGSRFRAAKMAGKMEEKKACYEEEQVEEGRTTGNRSYKGSPDRKRKAVQMALGRKHKDHPDWNERTSPQYSALKLGRKLQKQGVTEEEQVDEAAYSAKAARAGKDIGKPGKMFSKIAAKAGEKYGSEERGKKVAGAILKRIRAKHMKEDYINEAPIIPASALKPGQSLRDYMNARQGLTRRDSSTSTSSSTPQGAPGLKGPTGSSFAQTAMKSTERWADPGKRDYSSSNQGTVKTSSTSPTPAPEKTASWHAPMVRPPQELASKTADVNTGAPKVAQGAPMPTATATAPKNKEAGSIPRTVAESVQVGANKYRIV
jgi:hypothetical protein